MIRRSYVTGFVMVVVIALLLRVYALGSQSFWIDEISVTSFVRSGHLLSDLRDRGGPYEPPLHYLTVLAALRLPIGFETAARVPSAVFGAVEVAALMLLTREATNRRVTALVAGALLAAAPFAVRYSQENRYYVMFSALSLLTWWLVVRAARLRRRSGWLWYAAAAGAMLLTHPFAPLVLVAQALVVAVMAWRAQSRDARRSLARGYGLALLTTLVLVLPWFAYGALRWVPDAIDGKSYAFNPSGQFTIPLDRDLFERAAGWLLGNSQQITVLTALLLVVAMSSVVLARGRERIVAAAAIGYVLAFVLALVPLAREMGTYFAYRRVESLVPMWLLPVAIAIVAAADRLSARVPRRAAVVLGAGAALILVAFSLTATASYYRTEKTNYRAFARVVRDAPEGRRVVVPASRQWRALIRQYLDWKGVDRAVSFLVPGEPAEWGAAADGVTWLTGAPPGQPDLRSRPLNDLDSMQVIAGDRSGLLAILPWFVSTSRPESAAELARRRDAIAVLPPFLPAP